ncbi:hypothetical protein FC756_03765 [Lysinibacillus mangiferihumi]|uniref:Type I restriction modification DNA specificity domain-containing protein n=1 Tax=Lysinibacillus mangiferihumi TaxID=1130819 RepID=A0A4U2ZDR2_9BACI|nr:restriction endonuclease subunit S [Lysinibacillus mangiferihumi]TKI71922.1 hypothetical protein FC756_03765 [Lysinibacillus mangiferihumi]
MTKKKKTLVELLEEVVVPEDEQPYGIPENWEWSRLEGISNYIQRGKSPKYVESSNAIVVSQKCVQWSGFDISVARNIDEATLVKYAEERFLRKLDLLWNSTGTGTIGRVAIIEEEVIHPTVADSHVTVVRANQKLVFPKYLYYWLSSTFIQNKLENSYSGSTNQIELNLSDVKKEVIVLPPLEEQKRITNQIEVLFAKLDEAKQLIEEVKETFELRRAAILEKAFSGELTLEYRNVNQCIELVKPIASSKKFKSQIDQSITNTLYSLPENWKWVTLNNLIESMTYGSSAKTDDDSSGKAVLRMGNIQDGSLLNDNLKYLPLNHLDVKKFVLEENDILFNRTNSYELVGKSALVTQEFEGYSFASYLIRLSLIDKEILAPYVVTFINSKIGRKMLLSMVTQQVGQANINSQKLASLPIPLPPKNEIVEINKIIENLKAKERKAIESLNLDVDFANLKQSILSKAFKGELGTNDPTDESAIELLKSMLQEKL